MKKTLTINLSGLIFHIDEDAYELLQAYLEKLKQHFSGIEGQEEIVTDIETRMAELLQERLGSEKQVVSIADAEFVIDQLGQPFEMDDENTTNKTAGQTFHRTSRRLFRDPDHSKIAGVAAGLAAWAGIDVVWVRLIFILSLFASGAGLLIYIVLWIVLPEAITHAEKLEMRGDPVNISNIEKSVRKEMNEVSERIGKAAKDATETIRNKAPQSRSAIDRFFGAMGSVIAALFKVVGVLIGVFLIFLGLSLITGFFASLVGLETMGSFFESEGFSLSPILLGDLFFGRESLASLAALSIGLILFIPLMLIVYAGLKLVSAGRFRVANFTLISVTVWFASWIVALGLGIGTAFDFRHESREEFSVDQADPSAQSLVITTDFTQLNTFNKEFLMVDDELLLFYDQDRGEVLTFPQLHFKQSKDSLVHIRLRTTARGGNLAEAEQRRMNIKYEPELTDSSLHLPMLYRFPEEDLLRVQELTVYVEIPEGRKLTFDDKLYHEDLPYNRNYRYFKRYVGKSWMMTKQGLTEVK